MNATTALCATLFVLASAMARATDRADTTEFRSPAVMVEAQRHTPFHDATPSHQVPERIVRALLPATTAAIVSLAPGMFVRQYGGVGGLHTVSIRGGSASQALVTYDGVRLASAQNATVDLSLIPSTMIGSATIRRGSASALFGANAISGVVELVPPTPVHSTAIVRGSLGSFEEHRLTATSHLVGQGASVSLAADVHTTAGGYPMTVPEFDHDVLRTNTDARLISAMASARLGHTSVFALARTGARGVPQAVVRGSASGFDQARMDDTDLIIGARHTLMTSASTVVEVHTGGRLAEQTYADPSATIMGPQGLRVQFHQRDATASAVARHVVSGGLVAAARIEASWADLRGAMLQPGIGPTVQRRSAASALEVQCMPLEGTDVHAAVRVDAFSDAGMAVSPLVSVRHAVRSNVALRASWSYGFRPPTFNEMYYLNYGTSSLLPERASTWQAGVTTEVVPGVFAEVDVFLMNTTNLIMSIPISPVATSAQNVGRATSVGAEFGLRAELFDRRCLATASYTRMDTRDRTGRPGLDGTLLPYAPQEVIALATAWVSDAWTASLQWNYASHRYAQPGEEFTSILPPLGLVTVSVGTRGGSALFGADARVQCDNLLDHRYDVVRGFPMPGRVVRLIVDIQWTNSPQ
jgi:outer membrane cobalamin receptor